MPASAEWQRVQRLEDLMATVARINDLAHCVRTHAWRQGDWQTVFRLADDIMTDATALREVMSERWHELTQEATQ